MSTASPIITVYILFCAFLFGSVFGSAMNCLALRIVRHEKWGGKSRSKCPSCGHTLGALDLIPVVSYITLGGKCRYCKTKISPRYLIAELILGAAFALVALKAIIDYDAAYNSYIASSSMIYYGVDSGYFAAHDFSISQYRIGAQLLLNLIFTSCIFALSLCDIESFEIPDRFVLIPAVARVIYVFLFGSDTVIFGNGCGLLNYAVDNSASPLLQSLFTLADTLLVGAAVGGIFLLLSLFMDKILKKNSLGGGDIKLFAMTGLYFTPGVVVIECFLACIIGLVPSIIAMKKAEAAEAADADSADGAGEDELPAGAFPFGPAIAVAAYICILYGDKILELYLKLTGLSA